MFGIFITKIVHATVEVEVDVVRCSKYLGMSFAANIDKRFLVCSVKLLIFESVWFIGIRYYLTSVNSNIDFRYCHLKTNNRVAGEAVLV